MPDTIELSRTLERELHKLAARHMRRERRDHTLQTTAIVNEAWLRLFRDGGVHANDRHHFLAIASRVMRQVLVDYARARQSEKRAGATVSIDSAGIVTGLIQPQILDVHAALEAMATIAPRQAQLVELRFFGGLSLEEAAAVLEVSPRTADKHWKLARAWLRCRLGENAAE
jgi:RNA polymerase sigma factor (TIGR02999 family)